MSNIMQDLHTVGLNPFGVSLVAESLLKSPLAPLTVAKPQGFFFPVRREDCQGWVGVRFTLEAVPEQGGTVHFKGIDDTLLDMRARTYVMALDRLRTDGGADARVAMREAEEALRAAVAESTPDN